MWNFLKDERKVKKRVQGQAILQNIDKKVSSKLTQVSK